MAVGGCLLLVRCEILFPGLLCLLDRRPDGRRFLLLATLLPSLLPCWRLPLLPLGRGGSRLFGLERLDKRLTRLALPACRDPLRPSVPRRHPFMHLLCRTASIFASSVSRTVHLCTSVHSSWGGLFAAEDSKSLPASRFLPPHSSRVLTRVDAWACLFHASIHE